MSDLAILFCGFMTIALAVINIPLLFLGVVYFGRRNAPVQTDRRKGAPPSVSVVIPFHNEKKRLAGTLQSVIEQSARIGEIILMDDGSSDGYEAVLHDHFDFQEENASGFPDDAPDNAQGIKKYRLRERGRMRPHEGPWERLERIFLYKTPNQGKSKALDLGFHLAEGELVVTVDADGLLFPDAIERLIAPFGGDKDLIATFGSLGVLHEDAEIMHGKAHRQGQLPGTLFQRMQLCSMMNDFMLTPAYNRFDLHYWIVGAFAAFRKESILRIGGFSNRTLTEDRDICLDIYANTLPRRSGAIKHIPGAICLTELPAGPLDLMGQQTRWHGGWYQTLVKYRALIFNPRLPGLGLVMLPMQVLKAAVTALLWLHALAVTVLLLTAPPLATLCFGAILAYWLVRFVPVGYYHLIGSRHFFTHRLYTPAEHKRLLLDYTLIYPFFVLFYSFSASRAFLFFLGNKLRW
uniref:Glycosyltransferase, catalytic subunit of cellulose synthase and poly-beta-1,6-N-acetylglucosamine synthase n=1 Tax=Candidatus Kentrum sp. DK TaxID=2126562 RepID=A0A450SQ21_9GAMM|nr:MAG: Glycosyltransferase, catalytic subunit of cellulose synthase and poly-beta-1,6-N-acetylglucosamine synthase [Candidatus Kentron sp. DK]